MGLEADYLFETVYGISGNTRGWCDNARAFALGYRPQDDAEDFRNRSPRKPRTRTIRQRSFRAAARPGASSGRLDAIPHKGA